MEPLSLALRNTVYSGLAKSSLSGFHGLAASRALSSMNKYFQTITLIYFATTKFYKIPLQSATF